MRQGFTMIELLAAIALVALLTALLAPAIHMAREESAMTRDVQRSSQLGTVLQLQAQDSNGRYLRTAPSGTQATNSVEIFQNLIDQGYLQENKVLAANRYTAQNTPGSLKAAHVGWSYVAGMSEINGNGLPLLISRNALGNLEDLQTAGRILNEKKNPWGNKGVVVYFADGHAWPVRAGVDGVMEDPISEETFPDGCELLHPDSSGYAWGMALGITSTDYPQLPSPLPPLEREGGSSTPDVPFPDLPPLHRTPTRVPATLSEIP